VSDKQDMSLVLSRVGEFSQIAKTFVESGLFADVRSQAQAFVKIMAGAEMGIPPFTAMNSFHIIQGKTAMSAQAIAARIKSSGRYDYQIVEKSSGRCELQFYERGKHVHTEVWDVERARRMGVKNMDKMPEAMLFARAVTAGGRAVAPDVIGQFYTAEELGAQVDDTGEYIIEATATPVVQTTQPPTGNGPSHMPQSSAISHAATTTVTATPTTQPPAPEPTPDPLANTIDAIVERSQAMMGKSVSKAQFDAIKDDWQQVWDASSEAGVKLDFIPGSSPPIAYLRAIVDGGKQIIEAKRVAALPF
jgi:hypothetical protein